MTLSAFNVTMQTQNTTDRSKTFWYLFYKIQYIELLIKHINTDRWNKNSNDPLSEDPKNIIKNCGLFITETYLPYQVRRPQPCWMTAWAAANMSSGIVGINAPCQIRENENM